MNGDDDTGIEDAHGVGRGTHLEGSAHVGVRDRVVISVEAGIGVSCTRTTTRVELLNSTSMP